MTEDDGMKYTKEYIAKVRLCSNLLDPPASEVIGELLDEIERLTAFVGQSGGGEVKPEDRKRLKQHIEMVVEHKMPVEELEDMNRKLRLELHTLRFKESQEQRFIWWIWNVYVKNVEELITDIMRVTTYDTEEEAKEGKYALPKHCFDLIKKIDEYTEHIYDGTYLDVEISTVVKTSTDNNKGEEK